MVDVEHIGRSRADRDADPVPVLRPPLQGAQDQHVERALQQLDPVRVPRLLGHVGDCLPLGSRTSTTLDDGRDDAVWWRRGVGAGPAVWTVGQPRTGDHGSNVEIMGNVYLPASNLPIA